MFEGKVMIAGSTALLLALAAYWPLDPQAPDWVELLILWAVLLWVPLGFGLYLPGRIPLGAWLLPGLALGMGFWLPPSWLAGLLALPWLVLGLGALLRQAQLGTHEGRFFTAAMLFWNVAGAWAIAHALGWSPLGFAPIIVLLTAALEGLELVQLVVGSRQSAVCSWQYAVGSRGGLVAARQYAVCGRQYAVARRAAGTQ
jgi:hypothetical protein